MARGDFLKDLSGGIFTRLRELRQEQEGKDTDQKKQTLALLSSLADKVEPESLPLLMGHIGDVVGMKGDLRKFWDAFSGMPDMSVSTRLGSLMKNVSDSYVGPESAKNIRADGDLARLFQPTNPEQEANRQKRITAESDLGGKIVFRDPRQEKIEEIEKRYAAQTIAALEKQDMANQFRNAQQEDRQRHSKEMAELTANLKAESDIKEEAIRLANQRGLKNPEFFMQEAAKNIAQRQGWSDEVLRARSRYLNARTTESEAMARSMKDNQGLTPSQAINIEDRRREAARNLKGAFDKAMATRAEARKRMEDLGSTIDTAIQKARPGARFDPKTGAIVYPPGDPTSKFTGALERSLGLDEKIKEYQKAAAELAGAETQAKGHWGNLRTNPYSKYYKAGKEYTEPVEELTPGKSGDMVPPSLPTTGSTLPLTPSVAKGGIRIPAREGITLNVGQFVNYGGKAYVITGFDQDGTAIATPRKR